MSYQHDMVCSVISTAAFSHHPILPLVASFVGLTKLVCLKTTTEALSLPTTCLGSTSHGFLHGDKEFRKVEKVPIWSLILPQRPARQRDKWECTYRSWAPIVSPWYPTGPGTFPSMYLNGLFLNDVRERLSPIPLNRLASIHRLLGCHKQWVQ